MLVNAIQYSIKPRLFVYFLVKPTYPDKIHFEQDIYATYKRRLNNFR